MEDQNHDVHLTEPGRTGREDAKASRSAGVRVLPEARPLGCALAMRVMQSDLYPTLDDAERADCDELIRQNLDWFKRDNARGVPVVDMTDPDCWAILTPNGSRLVSPDEAKGRKDAYPLYTAETVAAAYQCGLAAARGVDLPAEPNKNGGA